MGARVVYPASLLPPVHGYLPFSPPCHASSQSPSATFSCSENASDLEWASFLRSGREDNLREVPQSRKRDSSPRYASEQEERVIASLCLSGPRRRLITRR